VVRPRTAFAAACALFVLFILVPAWPQAAPAYLWRAATGGQIRSRPAVGPDGTAYALSEDSFLYAWVSGGSLLWKHDLGWIPWDCLAVSPDGTVYAGLKNADFIAVNPRGGRLWTVRLDGLPAGDPAVTQDGAVLVGTSAGTLAAYSHLGRRVWAVTLPGAITAQPVIDGAGSIYVVAADRRLYALTPWGEFKWSLPFSAAPGAPAISSDGSIVLGTDRGELFSVNPAGAIAWRKSLGAPVKGVAANALQVVASTNGGRVAGFSVEGKELWRREAGRAVGAPPLLDEGRVILTALDGFILAVDPATGKVSTLAQGTAGGACLAPGGNVLVGGRDWIVSALEAPYERPVSAGTEASPWPQAGHDAMHSGRTDAAPRAGNDALLEANPDYLYLQGLLGSPGREGIRLFLSDVGSRVASRSLGKSTWYTVRMLENVAGLGLVTQSRLNQKLVNDFPDLRAEAAGLLGRVGSTSSRDALVRAARAETDGVALAAEIRALGAIASDGDGASLSAILQAFARRAALAPDSRLAAAVVDSIARITVYEGAAGPDAITTLVAISRGGYDPAVKAAALSVLHGDLKMDILNQEE
jgi:outer membrane protein assembly factor BamB